MAHLIDKDALVAEIERRAAFFMEESKKKTTSDDSSCAVALYGLLSFIDTLEVKEVDLDAELEHYKAEQNIKYEEDINMFEFAKHFFELGMRVNNPITAADRGMVEEIITHLKRVENDYRINLTKEMEWLRNKVK